ncbi:MAG: hypothetical protein WDW36_007192 [Sanguina aurantia]
MREASSAPVKQRMTLLQDVLGELQHAKTHQAYASLPGSGSGVWISVSLYRSVLHQLKYQVQEILEWESLLVATRQVAALEGSLAQQQEELQASQADWAQHKAELERQTDHCMALVKGGEGVRGQGAALAVQLRAARAAVVQGEAKARQAEVLAAEAATQLKFALETGGSGMTQRDALSLQVHDLAVQLSEARSQGEALRVQLASRQQPAEELVAELRRVRDDNGRLVALLASTPQFSGLSAELSSGSGLTYLPLGDLLLQQGLVGQAYLQLTDRWNDLKRVVAELNKAWAQTGARALVPPAYYETSSTGFAQTLREHGFHDDEIGTHAGLADTSLQLAVAPQMVRLDGLRHAVKPGAIDGVYGGDPRRSSAELGKLGTDAIVSRTVAAIRKDTDGH